MNTYSLWLFWKTDTIRTGIRYGGVQKRLISLLSKSREIPYLPTVMVSFMYVRNSMHECMLLAPGGRSAVGTIKQLCGMMQLYLTVFSNTWTTSKSKWTYYVRGRLYATYVDQITKDSGGQNRVMLASVWEGNQNEIGPGLGRVLHRGEMWGWFLLCVRGLSRSGTTLKLCILFMWQDN